MMSKRCMSKEFNADFILNLLDLAEMANNAEGDTIEFTIYEMDGIRMDASISFSYTEIDKEEN